MRNLEACSATTQETNYFSTLRESRGGADRGRCPSFKSSGAPPTSEWPHWQAGHTFGSLQLGPLDFLNDFINFFFFFLCLVKCRKDPTCRVKKHHVTWKEKSGNEAEKKNGRLSFDTHLSFLIFNLSFLLFFTSLFIFLLRDHLSLSLLFSLFTSVSVAASVSECHLPL